MAASLAHCHSGRGETWIAGSAAVEAQVAAQQTGWIAQPEDYLQAQIAVGQGWWEHLSKCQGLDRTTVETG